MELLNVGYAEIPIEKRHDTTRFANYGQAIQRPNTFVTEIGTILRGGAWFDLKRLQVVTGRETGGLLGFPMELNYHTDLPSDYTKKRFFGESLSLPPHAAIQLAIYSLPWGKWWYHPDARFKNMDNLEHAADNSKRMRHAPA